VLRSSESSAGARSRVPAMSTEKGRYT
jgi:hypothetical protein